MNLFKWLQLFKNYRQIERISKLFKAKKRKEMKLEDLIVRLRIEEDNRIFEKKVDNNCMECNAPKIP